jgi:hypothetical protein
MKYPIEKIDLPFDEIFRKINRGDFAIVHFKSTMIPYIYDSDLQCFYEMPEGYMEYDKKHYRKKIW